MAMSDSLEPKRLSRTYLRLQRGRVVFGDVLYSKGGSFGPRRQMDYQLVIIHTGFLTLNLDGRVIPVPEGYGILLSPGHSEHFRFAPHRETRHSWVAVAPELLSRELQGQFEVHAGPLPFLGRMATLLDMARQEKNFGANGDVLQEAAGEALGLCIMSAFAAAVRDRRKAAKRGDTLLWRMDQFISEDYARPLKLNDIARAAGVSRQHLLKLCRMAGRPTPMEQLYSTRLDLASDLLLHTGFSIGEIADQTGFLNQFHLSRRFKQRTGKSPSAWRGALWKQDRV